MPRDQEVQQGRKLRKHHVHDNPIIVIAPATPDPEPTLDRRCIVLRVRVAQMTRLCPTGANQRLRRL